MLRSRRFALIATIAVLGLSACGDAASTTTAGRSPAVIHLGAGGTTNAASVEGGAEDKMMAIQNITYVFDGSYPDLGSAAPSWTLPAGAQPDAGAVAKIAALLGVKGEVRQLSADQGGGWMVGPGDYSDATLTVSADGLLSWWFNPAPSLQTSGGCAMPVDDVSGGTDASGSAVAGSAATETTVTADIAVAPPDSIAVDPICEAPAPPANVPDKAAAEAKAKAFLADLGLDATQFELTSYADDYGANVTAWLLLGGHRSPVQVNIGFGAEGAIVWASGSLSVPQAAADYPLVTPEEALARLNDQSGQWYGGYYGGGMLRGTAADTAVSRSVTVSGGATEAAPPASDGVVAPATDVTIEPMPDICDPNADCVDPPIGNIEPITVHLTGVRLDVTMVWADDGTVWLLPAYTFTSADGGEYTVIAVDDQYIAQPEPTPVDTTVPGDTTVPVDTTTPGSVPDTTTPVVVDTTLVTDPGSAEQELVGLSVDEATKVAAEHGWTVRVVVLDGEPQIVTDDYSPDRINVGVADGVVTSIESRG